MFDFFRRWREGSNRVNIVVFREKKGKRMWRWGGYRKGKMKFISPVRYATSQGAYKATLEIFPLRVAKTLLKWGPEFITIKGKENPRLVTNLPMGFHGWETESR